MPQRRAVTLALSALTAGALLTATAVPAADAATPRPAATSAARHTGSLTTTVTGTVNGLSETGTFTINRFIRSGNTLEAVGNLNLGSTDIGTVAVPALVTDPPACNVLHLTLGPLDLSLLGLVVHLNQVNLDITAVPGAGNLLGNLLCAVAGLLDNTGALSAITNLLNQILGILNSL